MAATTSAGAKYCCKCGSDVTGSQRMKDSGGKYWCLACGQKDQREKARATGAVCAGCDEVFATGKMTELGGAFYCDTCIKKGVMQPRGGGGLSRLFDLKRLFASANSQEAARNKKLLMLLGLLVALIILVNKFVR